MVVDLEDLEADWKTCDKCPNKVTEQQDLLIHSDRWDSMKRSMQDNTLRYEIENATHKGKWVIINYVDYVCEFDNKPAMPDGVHHHCPHHGKELKKEDNWWE